MVLSFMLFFTNHLVRALVLPLYIIYAFSPIYTSVSIDRTGVLDRESFADNVTVGIVWVSILLDRMIQEDGVAGTASRNQLFQKSQDDEIILIKKKRILFREGYTFKPVLQVVTAPSVEFEKPLSVLMSYEVPRDLIPSHSEGYQSLCTGLSPPIFLS